MFTRQGLVFREVEPTDLALLREIRNTQWMGYRDPVSVQTMQMEKRWYDSLSRDSQAFIVMDGELSVGLLRFGGFDRENRAVTIVGVDVFPDARGKGYATKIMRAAGEYMLHDLGYHRIVGECTESNKGMRKAMESAGYTLEGRKRGYIWRSGEWHDFLQFSLLAEELWQDDQHKGPEGL